MTLAAAWWVYVVNSIAVLLILVGLGGVGISIYGLVKRETWWLVRGIVAFLVPLIILIFLGLVSANFWV